MRALVWDTYPNCRDLGGLPTPVGTTRLRRIARGPRREMLSAAGWEQARAWGLRTVIDLRCPYEVGHRDGDPVVLPANYSHVAIVNAPTEDHTNDEFRRVCFPILDSPEYWPHNLRILPDLVRHALRSIATAAPGILIHCGAGRDRTGMITAMLLANADVAPQAIAEDYAVSVRAMAARNSNSATHDRQSGWDEAEVSAWLESTRPMVLEFAGRIGEHFHQIRLDRADRDRLRALLLSDG